MNDPRLDTIVTDTFTAPRWVHYLFKMLVGAVVLAVLGLIILWEIPWWAKAGLFSAAWYLSLKASYSLDHHGRFLYVSKDLACDFSLHMMPVALLLALVWIWWVGALAAFLLLAIWVWAFPGASP